MNKVVLITGATGGIGRAIAHQLAGEGYDLQLHFHRNKRLAEQLRKKFEADKRHVQLFQADLTQASDIEQMALSLAPKPDIFVHCAGVSHYGLFADVSRQAYERLVQLHLTAPFTLTQRLLPHMLSRAWGRIIFITSIWGVTGASCEALYAMVKGGQNALAKSLGKEYASSGVTVNAVAPGAVETDMMASFTDEEIDALCRQIPAGRMCRPEEIAHLVRFLVSEGSAYMTGQVLRIDGGWLT
mgnify:FL=1